MTGLALEAFREQIRLARPGTWLFPSDENSIEHQKNLKTVWHAVRRWGVTDEWVTQLLRQGDAKVFKKYSQMKLQMKRKALQKLSSKANEGWPGFDTERPN